MTLNDDATPLSDLVLYRSLKKILGCDNPRFSVTKNKIIVKAKSEEESMKLLKTTKLGTHHVNASDEAQYNTRTGTMLLDRLRIENDSNESVCETLKEILEDQKHNIRSVTVYERSSVKTGRNIKIAKITFAQQTLPTFMSIGNKKNCN